MAMKAQIREFRSKKPEEEKTKNIGLRGVTVADTKISDVDGANGILIYRGYRIEELAKNSTFEETAYLLLHDELPTAEQLKGFSRKLIEARRLPGFVLESMQRLPAQPLPMDVQHAGGPPRCSPL